MHPHCAADTPNIRIPRRARTNSIASGTGAGAPGSANVLGDQFGAEAMDIVEGDLEREYQHAYHRYKRDSALIRRERCSSGAFDGFEHPSCRYSAIQP